MLQVRSLDQTTLPEIRNDHTGFEKRFLEYLTPSLSVGDIPILNQFFEKNETPWIRSNKSSIHSDR